MLSSVVLHYRVYSRKGWASDILCCRRVWTTWDCYGHNASCVLNDGDHAFEGCTAVQQHSAAQGVGNDVYGVADKPGRV